MGPRGNIAQGVPGSVAPSAMKSDLSSRFAQPKPPAQPKPQGGSARGGRPQQNDPFATLDALN